MVSSHNDLLKPDNILFDGERVWLVDWEAAFLNNRYVDLASVANFVLTGDDDERIYLQQYFGQPPTPYQQACFFLIRQLTHIFYAMAFLLLGSAGKPVRWTEDLPDFKDFHRRLWTGELNIRDSHVKVDYGKVHWQRLMENVRHPRFAEALKVVSATRAHS